MCGFNGASVSFRQAACPPALLGRMNASVRTLALATPPIGALLGGAFAQVWGFVPVLWVADAVTAAAAVPARVGRLPQQALGAHPRQVVLRERLHEIELAAHHPATINSHVSMLPHGRQGTGADPSVIVVAGGHDR